MFPVLLPTMEGSSNQFNSSYSNIYDDNVILNSVRSRKKVQDHPNCPVCSCTIRHGELETHLALEVERLQKLSCGTKRKLSSSSSSLAMPGSSSADVVEDEVDVRGCLGSDVYERVHTNRLQRLRARRRSTPPPPTGECPVCNATLPSSRLQRHALRCLKRTGAEMDDDVPDTSSEEGSIDVENDGDSPPAAAGFGAEYQWCGEWRVRASALQAAPRRHAAAAAAAAAAARPLETDQALVVDGDEDTELYGPPQYSPSRIAPDTETQADENGCTESSEIQTNTEDIKEGEGGKKVNGLVEASAETRIQALKSRIAELESGGGGAKCLICLGAYAAPAASIQCWHVHCEECWLASLKAKKICPQCNAITTVQHLRRIYM